MREVSQQILKEKAKVDALKENGDPRNSVELGAQGPLGLLDLVDEEKLLETLLDCDILQPEMQLPSQKQKRESPSRTSFSRMNPVA